MSKKLTKKLLIKSAREASRRAVRRARQANGAITYVQGKNIVKEYADGHEEVIETLDRVFVRPTQKIYPLNIEQIG